MRPPYGLRLGDVELAIALDVDFGSSSISTREIGLRAAAFAAEVAPHRPRVRIVEGSRRGATLDLDDVRTYVVGRGDPCDLLLDEEDISREHFAIERGAERIVVRDLGSRRGTVLGRSRLEPHRSAVWLPSRMVQAGDAVFALEIAQAGEDIVARVLEPLVRAEAEREAAALEAREPEPSPPASLPPTPATSAAPMQTPPARESERKAAHPRARDPIGIAIVVVIALVAVAAAIALVAILIT